MDNCKNCLKEPALCVCDTIRKQTTKLHVLILQHPQEPDKDLGSAHIGHLCLPNSTLRTGLSWPNLKSALGREAPNGRWAVLYLGSGLKSVRPAGETVVFVDKKGEPLPLQFSARDLDGIVVLDGTWSQAKAIWWRNPWLLKLKRAILQPSRPSLYRELRREPRRECLSTIETIAETLQALGEPAMTGESLRMVFQRLLELRRAQLQAEREQRRSGNVRA
jgi:DTW domain-containing protein